jgi:uncharacterized lipoprotein YmbA
MENSLMCRIAAVCVGAAFTLLTACATSAPTRFYVLSSLPASGAESRNAKLEDCTAVGVGPVELPDYLDRTEIVTRVSPNKLELAQFDQWAESLESNFSLVLAENLLGPALHGSHCGVSLERIYKGQLSGGSDRAQI